MLEKFEMFPDNRKIKEGALFCKCNLWYPIIKGIPRMLIEDMRYLISKNHGDFLKKYSHKLPKLVVSGKDKLQESTGRKHSLVKPPPPEFKNWDGSQLLWVEPLTPEFYKGKVILDAGCRMGTRTYFAGKWGAKLVIGVDIGESVETAFEVNYEMDNIFIIQADIFNIPTEKIFDFIYCMGVLHHMPRQKEAFRKLLVKTKQGGAMLIWVYRYEQYTDRNILVFLRHFTIHVNTGLLYLMSKVYTSIFFIRIKIYNRKYKTKKIQPNPFLKFLSPFRFDEIHKYVFNQLAPPIAKYYRKEELEELFTEKAVKSYQLYNTWNQGWKAILDLR